MSIYFVLGSTDGQRCFKRIEEFRNAGFEVKAFGFERGLGIPIAKKDSCEIIGSFPNSLPYVRRIGLMYNALNKLYSKYKKSKDSIIWYYFGEVIAIPSILINSNKKFIYEESDISPFKFRVLDSIKEFILRSIIRKSILTVFTADGFVDYHFGNERQRPDNIIVKPNKVNRNILKIKSIPKSAIDIDHLRFGFVGCIRFETIFNMAKIIGEKFKNYSFHFYGVYGNKLIEKHYDELRRYNNVFFHGPFKNPNDLPTIYSNIDVLVSTYGSIKPGVKYAEPNKLYESIYFRTPIIVSTGTFLGKKVENYGIGYAIDANNTNSIELLLNNMRDSLYEKIENIQKINQNEALEESGSMIQKLSGILDKSK